MLRQAMQENEHHGTESLGVRRQAVPDAAPPPRVSRTLRQAMQED